MLYIAPLFAAAPPSLPAKKLRLLFFATMATEIYVPDARDGHLPVEPKSAYATTVEEVPAATPNGTSLPYPKLKRADGTISDFQLEDRPIDEIKKLRVAIIGTGLSGVTAGALLPVKVPGIDLTLFEKNPDVVCQNFLFHTCSLHSSNNSRAVHGADESLP